MKFLALFSAVLLSAALVSADSSVVTGAEKGKLPQFLDLVTKLEHADPASADFATRYADDVVKLAKLHRQVAAQSSDKQVRRLYGDDDTAQKLLQFVQAVQPSKRDTTQVPTPEVPTTEVPTTQEDTTKDTIPKEKEPKKHHAAHPAHPAHPAKSAKKDKAQTKGTEVNKGKKATEVNKGKKAAQVNKGKKGAEKSGEHKKADKKPAHKHASKSPATTPATSPDTAPATSP